jgi:very-short-patch-repair endonuclease
LQSTEQISPLERGIRGVLVRSNTAMRRRIIPYDPRLKEVARRLRKQCTPAEVALWKHLRRKRVRGFDFHRQKPLDAYVVDFFCNELMLAIEIDGCSHEARQNSDRDRQARLESLGVRFLRFSETEVRQNLAGVVNAIEEWIDRHTPPLGHPSQEGKP